MRSRTFFIAGFSDWWFSLLTSHRSTQISYFFVTVRLGFVFLGICPSHLGHPICWHTTAQSALWKSVSEESEVMFLLPPQMMYLKNQMMSLLPPQMMWLKSSFLVPVAQSLSILLIFLKNRWSSLSFFYCQFYFCSNPYYSFLSASFGLSVSRLLGP